MTAEEQATSDAAKKEKSVSTKTPEQLNAENEALKKELVNANKKLASAEKIQKATGLRVVEDVNGKKYKMRVAECIVLKKGKVTHEQMRKDAQLVTQLVKAGSGLFVELEKE